MVINMIIIRMTGGLGNQMFQYALYLKLKSQGKEVFMDDFTEYEGRDARPLMLWVFGIRYECAGQDDVNKITDGLLNPFHRIRRKLFGRQSLEYQEGTSGFNPQVLQRDPAYLTGYFQSRRYFEDVEELVREAFAFSDTIWTKVSDNLSVKIREYQKQIADSLAVSLHIRRGDYLENQQAYGEICTTKYYEKAIQLIQESHPEAVFFLFSNDTEWVRQWASEMFKDNECYQIIEGTTEDTGYLDMLLMSQCKHHILANSSFSWWGAWLNASKEKLVIAPAKWFNNQEDKDIYTKDMIRISADGEVISERM